MNGLEISRANPEEASRLSTIALTAKGYWGYPAEWMERWAVGLTITPEYIRDYTVFCGRFDGRVIGFYGLIGSPPRLMLDHLWVLPEFIGQGHGRQLFQHAMGLAAAAGGKEVEIEADPHAEEFYKHMGSRRIGEYVYELDGRPRILPKLLINLTDDLPE